MAIRGIFFDAADVLYRRPEPTRVYVSRLLAERGFPTRIPAEDQERHQALRSQAKIGHIRPGEYWEERLRMHGVSVPEERRALTDSILDYSDHILPIPGGPEALAALKQRGFVLGIVTDTMHTVERKTRWLDMAGVGGFIDVMVCSSAFTVHKPDPAIYLEALSQARLTPSESAFVGHAADELRGARRAGLTTVAVYEDSEARADYHATSLLDLLSLSIFLRTGPPEVRDMHNANNIDAIFFDHGNTMRVVIKDADFQARARQQLADLIGTGESPDELVERLMQRYQVYRKQAKTTLTEASERELWTQWMLPDLPPEMIAPLAGKLTRLWRNRDGRRVPRPDVKQVVIELARRGYRQGIIANTITESEIPDWLEEEGLAGYFEEVVLSSTTGLRKPGPEIFHEAARRLGVDPACSAYIGDNPSRDIVGANLAGFGMVVILREPATLAKEPPSGEHQPDRSIQELSELLDIFPERQSTSDSC